MPAKRAPRAWTVWRRRGGGWEKWYTIHHPDKEESTVMLAESYALYVEQRCRVLPAGQRPGRKKAEVAK